MIADRGCARCGKAREQLGIAEYVECDPGVGGTWTVCPRCAKALAPALVAERTAVIVGARQKGQQRQKEVAA